MRLENARAEQVRELDETVELLQRSPVRLHLIGPCEDGGYYLIGLKKPAPRLLRDVKMSTPDVTRDTLSLALEEGLRTHILPTWYDIDDADTLVRLRAEFEYLPDHVALHTRRFLAEYYSGNSIPTHNTRTT